MSITLTITAGPYQGKAFTFTQHDTFLVGRSADAHLALPQDQFFSRRHFLIELNPPLCRLVDLRSRNGTRVNGKKVQVHDLRHGDRIEAGTTQMEVALSEEAQRHLEAATWPATGSGPTQELPNPAAHPGATPSVSVSEDSISTAPPPAQLTNRPPVPPEPAPAIPGYAVLDRIGGGAMGVVYKARKDSGELAAIKVIRPKLRASTADMARFLREARILQTLRHPGIVAYHHMSDSLDLLYFVMEYVPGRNLGQLAAAKPDRRLDQPLAVRLMLPVLDALAYAHGRGFVHRDVKPANILVLESANGPTVKLADFGMAKVYHASPLSGLTLTGEMGGTAAFLPPEQAVDFKSARPSADQFAAAATLYTLLTGRFIYPGPQQLDMIFQALDESSAGAFAQPLSPLPPRLDEVVQKALARRPADRFADVARFRQELLPFADA